MLIHCWTGRNRRQSHWQNFLSKNFCLCRWVETTTHRSSLECQKIKPYPSIKVHWEIKGLSVGFNWSWIPASQIRPFSRKKLWSSLWKIGQFSLNRHIRKIKLMVHVILIDNLRLRQRIEFVSKSVPGDSKRFTLQRLLHVLGTCKEIFRDFAICPLASGKLSQQGCKSLSPRKFP